MSHRITLLASEPVTHDTTRLVFDKPAGYAFTPGQSCEMRLDRDGWREEGRDFSIVSLPEAEKLEFIVKSYGERDGVTARIPDLRPGESVRIGAPFGDMHDRGPGVFIAGGAGITPFIPILRRRARDGDGIAACTLIYANRTEDDILLRDEWEAMEGLTKVFTVTRQEDSALPRRRIDAELLNEILKGFRDVFYVCGPQGMVDAVLAALREHGVPEAKIVRERD